MNYNSSPSAEAAENTRNTPPSGSRELLAVSFGTSYAQSRLLTISAIEEALEQAFPEYSVRRAFTSGMILKVLRERDHIEIDDVSAALERAAGHVSHLAIQPTHLMDGLEFHKLIRTLLPYASRFEGLAVGAPLLSCAADFRAVVRAITEDTREYDDGQTAICFMGHGTEAASNAVYARLQALLSQEGYPHYYIGTVEADPTLQDLLAMVAQGDYRRVVLQPLMLVAGDHAHNDMAGDDLESWRSCFHARGYEVVTRIRGLGSLPAIQQLFIDHARFAVQLAEKK